jgi:hypothetical protein
LYNNSYSFENYIICGTRGWNISNEIEDKRIFRREMARLELSLKEGIQKYGEDKEIIVCMHYPPISSYNYSEYKENLIMLDLLKRYNVKKCIYGHLHGKAHKNAVEGEILGIDFKLVSSDYLNFELYKI